MIDIKDINQDPSMDLFASPSNLDSNLRSLLDEASSILCDWLAKADKANPSPSYFNKSEFSLSLNGISKETLFEELKEIIDGSFQPSSPGALAHLDPPPLTSSIVGDLIAAGLNNNLLAKELSPSLSSLEKNICKWFASQLGMSEFSGGVAASGGSISNLMALVLARFKSECLYEKDIAIIASSDAHVSISRALKIMGIPETSLYHVETNDNGQLLIDDIKNALISIQIKNLRCIAIVATAGTTVSGAIDPLSEIADLCLANNIWFHVDASIGGVYALSDSTNYLLNGISRSNSITINPQKILGIAKTSSLLLVSNTRDLYECFSTGFPYLEQSNEDDYQRGELGLQGSRSAEILKLWLGLRQLGIDGISRILDNSLTRKNYFLEGLKLDRLNLINGPLHLLSFRPKELSKEDSFNWSINTREILLKNKFMLSSPFYKDRFFLKAVFGNPHTTLAHLDHLVDIVNHSLK